MNLVTPRRRPARQTVLTLAALGVFLLGALAAPPLARADPILITAGQIVVGPGLNGQGQIDLTGTRGFSVMGVMSGQAGIGPKSCFPCDPGTPIPLSSAAVGLDLLATVATFEGTTYPQLGGASSPNNLPIFLSSGAVTAPPFSAGSQVTLTAPFEFASTFTFGPNPFGPTSSVPVFGSGLATLTLVQVPGGSQEFPVLWQYDGVRFDFADASAPVPEPGTLVLLGGGVALLAGRWRRNLTRSSSRAR